MKLTFYISLSVIVFTSCVSMKKYKDLESKKTMCDNALVECNDDLGSLQTKYDSLLALSKDLNLANSGLQTDTQQLKENVAKLKSLFNNQQKISNRLKKQYEELLDKSTRESGRLAKNLAQKEKSLLDLEQKLETTKANNEALARNLAEREKRLKELEKLIADQENAVKQLKDKITQALLGFEKDGLTVEVKDGKVYVSVDENLLFSSGSRRIDTKGKQALTKLAGVLKTQEDINIMVEGHTDDVPWKKGAQGLEDNWDLSVLRATAITRILLEGGVEPSKVIPSGRGEHLPLQQEKTKEARAKNRRTEIILVPDLDALFAILENN